MTQAAPGPGTGPLISVVLPTYNSALLVEEALQSLAGQTWRDFEVVVSDGASQDETLDRVRAFAFCLPALTVLSRPDRGVYDAINLGIQAARGQWCLVLGSDDRLHAADTLARMSERLLANDAAMVYGDVRMMAVNGHRVPPGGRYAGAMPLPRLLRANICQQAIFYRRIVFEGLGGFKLEYPVQADWEFNLRVAFRFPTEWVDVVVTDYAATGLSSQRADPLAEAAIPEMVRRHFVANPGDRRLWPLQRVLLRQADGLRRRGQWRGMLRHWLSYGWLAVQRSASRVWGP